VKSNLKRLAAVAAVGATAILVPAAGASAAVTPALPALPLAAPHFPLAGFPVAGFPALTPRPFPFVAPGGGQVVIGPTIITTAPSSFINTNNQVSVGGAVAGGQVAG
jgi:hypothetical protein